jgi:DNA-binding SARP family transcriptional activator
MVYLLSADGRHGLKVMFSLSSSLKKYTPNIVSGDKIIPIDIPIEAGKWMKCELDLDMALGKIHFSLDDRSTTVGMDLAGMQQLSVTFGAVYQVSSDVVNMTISDVRTEIDGKLKYRWLLAKHNGDVCYDELEHRPAVVKCGNWMIDRSLNWKPVLTLNRDTDMDLAFDSVACRFYVVGEGLLETYATDGKRISVSRVGGSLATGAYGHVVYDQTIQKIISYDFTHGIVSTLSPQGGSWSFIGPAMEKESRYYCRASAFYPKDSCYYFFGGYGFFEYSDKLHYLDPKTGTLKTIDYSPKIPPRMSVAACVVGDEMFIAGGRGNEVGKQEVREHFYYDLYAINLRTRRSRCLWSRNDGDMKGAFSFCSTMLFDPADSTFYAMQDGSSGRLLKIWMNEARREVVSDKLDTKFGILASEGAFFVSPRENKVYAAYNMMGPDGKHRITVYSLDTPLLDSTNIRQAEATGSWITMWLWLGVAIVIIIVGGGCIYIIRRKIRGKVGRTLSTVAPTDSCGVGKDAFDTDAPVAHEGNETVKNEADKGSFATDEAVNAEGDDPLRQEYISIEDPVLPTFNRNRSSISFLGGFSAYNDKGEDMTASFTPRLKSLLILIILHTENNKYGISAETTADLLWGNSEILSTRNNLNVSLRRLRMLIDQDFGLSISNDSGYLYIHWKKGVFCDYHELLVRLAEIKNPDIDEERYKRLFDEILGLLSLGTLLPEISEEWIDSFKSSFSNVSLDFLFECLRQEMRIKNYPLVSKLADIIFAHDSLNDAALSAKCKILTLQGRRGIAKNVYNHFCKEYLQVYGEEYDTPFSKL